MRNTWNLELKVGLFITLGLALILISIIVLGSTESLMTRKNHYHAHFTNVEGLIPGAKVVMGGLQVGTVDEIAFDSSHRDIRVSLQVARAQADWIRGDSAVEIQTQGVLGDKFLTVIRGSDDQAVLPPESELPNRTSAGINQFISKGDQLLVTLQSIAGSMDHLFKTFEANHRSETIFQGMATTAKNLSLTSEKLNQEIADLHLKTVSKNLNGILEKVNNGTGTLGALVNDPGLYDDVKALMGGANRNRVMRNLVRQTIKKNEEAEAAESVAAPAAGGKKK
jgi:phospholipid/cholesterol/gamma-HCH transport system substrate-binding protein